MKVLAEIGFVWLVFQSVGLLAWALVEAWRTPSRWTRRRVFRKELA